MRHLLGRVKTLNREPVLEAVEIRLTEWTEHGGKGLKNWKGYFRKESGPPFLDPGEHYVLHLEDGRKGEMLIANVSPGDDYHEIRFSAAGPLE